jgi:hypothetical protein
MRTTRSAGGKGASSRPSAEVLIVERQRQACAVLNRVFQRSNHAGRQVRPSCVVWLCNLILTKLQWFLNTSCVVSCYIKLSSVCDCTARMRYRPIGWVYCPLFGGRCGNLPHSWEDLAHATRHSCDNYDWAGAVVFTRAVCTKVLA